MEENIYKNAKVVVVDDVEEVLHSTKNCLKFEGMQVECFNNPIEALEYLKNNKADVLLLDFFMPQMNGDEFVKQLREFNQETIIILQTGYSDKIPPLEMIDKMNIQGYLDKLKGEDELVLMTKAAIKTSFLNKEIRKKDKEITKLSYKKAIMGNLIVNLVNEAKDQLMQIGGMNSAIATDENYQIESKGIQAALEKTYKLYEALNFETLKEVMAIKLKETIEILLKPTLLVNNSTLVFSVENENEVIYNVNDVIYIIIKTVEILTKNNIKNINIKRANNMFEIYLDDNIDKNSLNELEMLEDEKYKIKIVNNKISF